MPSDRRGLKKGKGREPNSGDQVEPVRREVSLPRAATGKGKRKAPDSDRDSPPSPPRRRKAKARLESSESEELAPVAEAVAMRRESTVAPARKAAFVSARSLSRTADESPPPKKRRTTSDSTRRHDAKDRKRRSEDRSESEVEDEDDLYISDSFIQDRPKPKSGFAQAMALLKQKRNGLAAQPVIVPDAAESSDLDTSDDGSDKSSTLDDELKDFVDDASLDEDEDAVGVAALPAEFRISGDFFDSFKIFLKYLIDLALRGHTAVIKTGEYAERYLHSVRAVENRIDGYRTSLLSSEAWKPKFKEAMDTYPTYRSRIAPGGSNCGACTRKELASSHAVTVSGRPYDPWTLESLPVPTLEKRVFHVGAACAARSDMYSHLRHFKFHFYERLKDGLADVEDLEAHSRDELFEILEEKHLIHKKQINSYKIRGLRGA
ncbi:Coiled-coil domain-containing protein 82 [Thoreauomyces humboldtii]|nr:Coiled-coil domain-containing protein 82 [Thoreauomyces humboldtii]